MTQAQQREVTYVAILFAIFMVLIFHHLAKINPWGGTQMQAEAEAHFQCTEQIRYKLGDEPLDGLIRSAIIRNCEVGFMNGRYWAATGGQRPRW